MGPLALIVVIARSVRYATPPTEAMLTGFVAMFAFATVGAIAGRIASAVIEDAVRSQVAAELAAGATEPSTTAKSEE
jgi:hypothetical protein